MGKKLYVGNLAFSSTEDSINDLFSQHGTVDSCHLVMDRDTGRSKGFCFVEMSSQEEAESAISNLDGKEVEGRALKVNEARPKPEGFRNSSRNSFSSQNSRSDFNSSSDNYRSSY